MKANERFISLDAVIKKLKDEIQNCKPVEVFDDYITEYKKRVLPKLLQDVINYLERQPTVDAVEVDEIRVDIMRLCLENQEAILNVSICGKPNEVKLPFSKEVVEVVHGHNLKDYDSAFECSVCGWEDWDTLTADSSKYNYCPNCGAKMDLE